MRCKICGNVEYKNNLCERHFVRGVNKLRKVIDHWRIKGTPYKATHVRESWGIDGTYTESPYRNKK